MIRLHWGINMKSLFIGLTLGTVLFSFGLCFTGPTKPIGSYRAFGEIVESLPDAGNIILQMNFEENYDSSSGDLEFAVKELGHTVMFVENKMTKQTYKFVEKTCEEMSVDEWIETASPPGLSKYESLNGSIRFSMGQLFAMKDSFLKADAIQSEVRGIPAKKWIYEIKGTDKGKEFTVEVEAFWSDPKSDWDLTSPKGKSVPLVYTVRKIATGPNPIVVHQQFINVFGFLIDSVDKQVFEARQGIICPNRKPSHKFPKIDNYRAVSFHSEVIFPDYQEIKTIDGWFDAKNKLLKMNIDRIKDEDTVNRKLGRKYVSEMISGILGVSFRVTWFMGKGDCKVSSLVDYEYDIQDLVNPKIADWKLQKVFGLNDTTYVYIGKNSKRNIPCHVFQGIRKDWPETSAQVTSLWEWCFAMHLTDDDEDVIFRDNEMPLVNVEVTVLESDPKGLQFPVGFKLIHHFYDVKVEDPDVMDLVNFDIRYCFGKESRRELQFAVNVKITEDNKDVIENATSDVNFLKTWKTEILRAAGLTPESLRISKMESTVIDDKLYIRFMLLGVHKDLPQTVKEKQKSLADAEKSLKDVIDQEKLTVKYKPTPKSEFLILTSTKDSLSEQINKTLIDTVPTIKPPETTTPVTGGPSGFSIVTDPEKLHSTQSTDGQTGIPTKSPIRTVLTGHQPSTVAAVTIIMLLLGITIGSAGTFVKFNGLPACLSRR